MAGDLPPAGAFRGSVTRVAARLTTPLWYLAVLGGMEVLLLWTLRGHLGVGWPLAGAAGLLVTLAVTGRATRGQLTLWAVLMLGLLTTIGPTLSEVLQRPRRGLTMEHDGLLQVESAIDRVLKGQPIYGVDWSTTPMARFPWDLTPGGNPALHHMAYYPLTVLVGVPFRLLMGAFKLPFDYRIVLICFALVAIGAIVALPVGADRRTMMMTAVTVSPLIGLFFWAGRNDIEFIAFVLLCLALLSRGHPSLAGAALGVAVALKPFAWVAVPFYLLVLYLQWRSSRSTRDVFPGLAALVVVPVATILPFFLANPSAFWTDVVLYAAGGVKDAYPIAGYGFGEFLYQMHVIAHRTDSFPFGIVQLAAIVPVLWLTVRAFLRRPTLGRWMTGYACLLLAFTFFARFFNDNYAADVITLFLCIRPLGDRLLAPATAAPAARAARLAA